MARSHGVGRSGSIVAVLCLMVIMMGRTPLGASGSSCRASGHHCPEIPSLTCCCGGETAALFEGAARPVTKHSLIRAGQPFASSVVAVGAATAQSPRVGWATDWPMSAGPPLDRPILYAALLL